MEQDICKSVSVGKIWNACGYARLSHEDPDQTVSNSIKGQTEFIRDYIKQHKELLECGMKADDGFSGSSFDRPGFQEMMEEVRQGKFNCIVVKDLSRFGRNYLEAGAYIEKIFPFFGVRFIAVNDHYDSLYCAQSDELIIPFKNLINEVYCLDSSMKIRSQLAAKRRRGEFTGAFAVYGYLKDPENKNRLITDPYAAGVVRDIFKWKLEGISAGDIADRLNADGILAPMDYKKSLGMHYNTPFRIYSRSLWNAAAVLRILKNPIYTGVLEQGKCTTPSYKVKKRIMRPQEEWAVAEGVHEAVIHPQEYETVQKVLALDTRTRPGGRAVELFSGMVSCGECGAAMVRKTVAAGGRTYIYYVCAAHKNNKTCSAHSIRDQILEEIVLDSFDRQIPVLCGQAGVWELAEAALRQNNAVRKLQDRLDKKQEEISRYKRLIDSLYKSFSDCVLDQNEYVKMKQNYAVLCAQAESQAQNIRRQAGEAVRIMSKDSWIEQFKKRLSIPELDRALAVFLIDRIFVYRDKRVEIVYSWKDEYKDSLWQER